MGPELAPHHPRVSSGEASLEWAGAVSDLPSSALPLQKEVIQALLKLIKLNPIVVKEVFNRLLGTQHGR